jgi:hypothetical protein
MEGSKKDGSAAKGIKELHASQISCSSSRWMGQVEKKVGRVGYSVGL